MCLYVYVIYIGGDFMRGRMFTAAFLVALVVGGLVLAVDGPALTPAAAGLAVALCIAALRVANTTQYENRIPDSGIGNERANYQPLWLTQRRAQHQPPAGLERPDSVAVALKAYAEAYGTNDTYVVSFSLNGRDFGNPWVAGPVKDAAASRRVARQTASRRRPVTPGSAYLWGTASTPWDASNCSRKADALRVLPASQHLWQMPLLRATARLF
jgi:hypothetical protein